MWNMRFMQIMRICANMRILRPGALSKFNIWHGAVYNSGFFLAQDSRALNAYSRAYDAFAHMTHFQNLPHFMKNHAPF